MSAQSIQFNAHIINNQYVVIIRILIVNAKINV
jgi:hypothetical protein